jgi:hypothetical protein
MTIEETHPSLKLIYCRIEEGSDEGIYTGMFDKEDVQKHTIDKAVLLQIICRMPLTLAEDNSPADCTNWLLKELGLENDNDN